MPEFLTQLFGKGSPFMEMLSSEGFGNLVKGGASLYSGMQAGDMMDFQKDLANKQEIRTDTLFNQDQEDREKTQNLNFG